MVEYEQGSDIRLYTTWRTHAGEEADVSSGIVTISHIWGSEATVDVGEQALTLLSGSTFYYDWNIPAGADKTTYNARYIGTYSTGEVVVGGEDFLVIPRRFYDRKGGGLVQRIRADIWTKKEKESVIKALEDLTSSSLSELRSIEEDMSKFSGDLVLLSNSLKSNSVESVSKILTEIEPKFLDIKTKIDGYEEVMKGLNYDDSKMVKKIAVLSNSVLNLDTDLRNERISMVISELEDLHKEFDEFKEVFVESLSIEAKERVSNEIERNDS